MTPEQLCEKLGGYANINKLVAVVNGKPQYLARMNAKGEYEFTELGKTLAAEHNAAAAVGLSEEKPEPKRRRKAAAPADDAGSEEVAQASDPE